MTNHFGAFFSFWRPRPVPGTSRNGRRVQILYREGEQIGNKLTHLSSYLSITFGNFYYIFAILYPPCFSAVVPRLRRTHLYNSTTGYRENAAQIPGFERRNLQKNFFTPSFVEPAHFQQSLDSIAIAEPSTVQPTAGRSLGNDRTISTAYAWLGRQRKSSEKVSRKFFHSNSGKSFVLSKPFIALLSNSHKEPIQ